MTHEPERLPSSILIVDDEPANIRVLVEMLKQDHEIFISTDGREALEKAAANPPDLVLLDIVMPGLDGYEVCRRLKADERTRHIPVIFITVRSTPQEETRGFAFGAVDYITKPFYPVIVKARVQTQLDLKRHRDHLEEQIAARTLEFQAANSRLAKEVRERKQAEDKIRAALKEKEILLREVHHRVKNNLQIVSSLLRMTQMKTTSPEAVQLIEETDLRLFAIGLIHVQLYQSSELDRVDLAEHIRTMSGNILQTFEVLGRIDVQVAPSNVLLSLNQALPCILALNELISTMVKQAVRRQKTGCLAISVAYRDDGQACVSISDPEGMFEPEDMQDDAVLGAELINGLVEEQLGGRIDYKRNGDTRIIICFAPVTSRS